MIKSIIQNLNNPYKSRSISALLLLLDHNTRYRKYLNFMNKHKNLYFLLSNVNGFSAISNLDHGNISIAYIHFMNLLL